MSVIPKTMTAAILAEQKKPLILDRVTLPENLLYGQVLVKISCTGICGSQLNEIAGTKGPDPYIPHLLGHEGAGTVIAVGDGVRTVSPEDHVVLHWRPGAGIQSAVPQYHWQGNPLNAGWVTTFNSYAIVSENRVTAIDKSIDFPVASLLGCAVTTGLGTINNNAQLKIGQSVLIIGAGGVGMSLVQGATLAGGHPIVAADIFANKLALADELGATHTINTKETSLLESGLAIVGAAGFDVVIETTGIAALIETAYEMTHAKGRTVLVGVPDKGIKPALYTLPLHFEKVLTGSHGGEAQPAVEIPRYLELYKAGRLPLDELITERFSFNDINTALEEMRAGKITGRCILEFE